MATSLTRKLTVEVDTQTYDRITRDLHHGQLSQLMRTFTASLDLLLTAKAQDEIYLWLYGKGQLTLPNVKEHEKDGTSS
jgi:hypothetical protein